MAKKHVLSIWMNGDRVASWSRHKLDHELVYEPDWVLSPQGRPLSLSLPFIPGNQPHRGDRVRWFFENLLPDRADVRNRLRDRFHAASAQAFDLLAEIGRDCIGAIQVLADDADIPAIKEIKGEALSEAAIARSLEVAGGLRLPGFESDDFRISLAGAQEKTAFLWHKKKWQRPLEATPSTHIFKLPMGGVGGMVGPGTGSIENEWLCSKIVAAYGLPVAPSTMASFGAQQVLIVERFDRKLSQDKSWLLRLPVEDFCQIKGLPPEKKYEADGGPGIDAIMSILAGSSTPECDREIFFKAQMIFWLLAAADGHAKNFSIYLDPQGQYHLAPLYDILSVYPWTESGVNRLPIQKLKMAMAVRGKNPHYHWDGIHRNHWEETARRNGLGSRFTRLADEVIEYTPKVIQSVLSQLPADFPANIADAIFSGMRRAVGRLVQD